MHRASFFTIALAAVPALAQSNVSPSSKFCWGENIGFTNWRDANAAVDGVRVGPAGLSGFIWGENVGWINTGAGGGPYANSDNTNFGVNVSPNGMLTGYAWGENIGWIKFGYFETVAPTQRARFDPVAGRLRGFAWGENIGWINLDDAATFVALQSFCYPNCDQSTIPPILNVQDFACFLNKFASGDPYANCDSSTIAPVLNVQDFSCFLNKFAAGCS